jgi:hypothetical protein
MDEVDEQVRVLRWSSTMRSGHAARELLDLAELPRQRSPLDETRPPAPER